MTTAPTTTPNVPLPAGATAVGEWALDGGNARHFRGTTRRTIITTYGGAALTIETAGEQWVDGRIDRYIEFTGGPG